MLNRDLWQIGVSEIEEYPAENREQLLESLREHYWSLMGQHPSSRHVTSEEFSFLGDTVRKWGGRPYTSIDLALDSNPISVASALYDRYPENIAPTPIIGVRNFNKVILDVVDPMHEFEGSLRAAANRVNFWTILIQSGDPMLIYHSRSISGEAQPSKLVLGLRSK